MHLVIRPAGLGDLSALQEREHSLRPPQLIQAVTEGRVLCICTEGGAVVGTLRWSLFRGVYPFLDLLWLDAAYRGRGWGRLALAAWEAQMERQGYRYLLTSTQADEEAWAFYEHLGYRKTGGFYPPEQQAEEWIYQKELCAQTDKKKNLP